MLGVKNEKNKSEKAQDLVGSGLFGVIYDLFSTNFFLKN